MSHLADKDIKFLPGVGPKKAELLNKELDIYSYEDLLYYFPYKYIDRSKFYKIREIDGNISHVQLKGKIVKFDSAGRGNKQRLIAYFSDQSGIIELVWFRGIKWIKESLATDKEYVVFGKPSLFNSRINIIHPEVETVEKFKNRIQTGFQAFYNTTEKLKRKYINSKFISKLQNNLLKEIKNNIHETLSPFFTEQVGLLSLPEALINIHFPKNQELLKRATYRLKFEELFFIQLNILQQRNHRLQKFKGFIFDHVGDLFHQFYQHHLPFELTDAQKRVLKEIRKDLGSGIQMNRLLQGDVGSGKTLVALMSILIALDNNYQTCIMAPTEILATQHYHSISEFLKDLPVSVYLLTGSTSHAERKKIHEKLQDGSLRILIGTHALIEDTVKFNNLGLVIIDEQHRFGVVQRAKLWKKNVQPPHVLVMTATPIPRTLSMTVYGDLEVSVIDELPPGRKPIRTIHYYDSKRLKLFAFMKKVIAKGFQIYVVFPLIRESEKLDLKDLEDGYEGISRAFPPPKYAVGVVHGRMKPEEKEKSMKYFARGKTNILVSTTVIEVGVDVPNATVMVIENAERFGLSQLHQLRGRVGRGGEQSYCILMTKHKLTHEARKRLETMVRTNDGFEIAETDMQLRGPGDIEGTQQSGIPFDFKIANLSRDGEILQYARSLAMKTLEDDPELKDPKNSSIKSKLDKIKQKQKNYSVIS